MINIFSFFNQLLFNCKSGGCAWIGYGLSFLIIENVRIGYVKNKCAHINGMPHIYIIFGKMKITMEHDGKFTTQSVKVTDDDYLRRIL